MAHPWQADIARKDTCQPRKCVAPWRQPAPPPLPRQAIKPSPRCNALPPPQPGATHFLPPNGTSLARSYRPQGSSPVGKVRCTFAFNPPVTSRSCSTPPLGLDASVHPSRNPSPACRIRCIYTCRNRTALFLPEPSLEQSFSQLTFVSFLLFQVYQEFPLYYHLHYCHLILQSLPNQLRPNYPLS